MVYSGGAVTFGIPGIGISEVRVSGPLIAYVDGRRFEVTLAFGTDNVNSGKGGYGGLAMPFASNFLYVDSSGVFQVASAWPAGDPARIAEVTVASGTVSGVVDARLARFAFTETDILEWNPDSSTLSVLASGSPSSSRVVAGSVNAVSVGLGSLPPGQLRIGTDTNTSSVEIGRAGSVTEIVGSLSQASGDFNLSGDAVSTIKTTNSLSPLGIITEGAISDIVLAADDPSSNISLESAGDVAIEADGSINISTGSSASNVNIGNESAYDVLSLKSRVTVNSPPTFGLGDFLDHGITFGPISGSPNRIPAVRAKTLSNLMTLTPPDEFVFHPPRKIFWEKRTDVIELQTGVANAQYVKIATIGGGLLLGPTSGTGTAFISGAKASEFLGDPSVPFAFTLTYSWTINDTGTAPTSPGNFSSSTSRSAAIFPGAYSMGTDIECFDPVGGDPLSVYIKVQLPIPSWSANQRAIIQITIDSSYLAHE